MSKRWVWVMADILFLPAGILNGIGGILHGDVVRLLISVGFAIIGCLYLLSGRRVK